MNTMTLAPGSLAEALARLPDPRRVHLRVHEAVALLQMVVAAMLCGARSLYAIAQWGAERREDDPDLLVDLGLKPGRSPSVATLHRYFKRLDGASFERVLGEWLARTGVTPEEPMAVDGKTLRGIHGEEVPGVHLVAVYALRAGAVLSQIRAPGKGAELPATKEALAQVDLAGHVVMGDALQTQREVCAQIVESGGEYLLPVKENQPALLADIEEAFSPPGPRGAANGECAHAAGVAAGQLEGAGCRADDGVSGGGQGGPRPQGAAGDVGTVGRRGGGVCRERRKCGGAVAVSGATLLDPAGAHGEGEDDGRRGLRDHEPFAPGSERATDACALPGVLGDREPATLGPGRDDG
jgi:hypothetical protein